MINRTFSKTFLEDCARKAGFIQRKRKLTASIFLETLMFKTFNGSKESLTDHCLELANQHQVTVRKQSMDAKFNAKSVDFIRKLVDHQLQNQLSFSKVKIQGFDRILIQDSTRFGLPKRFKSDYKGYATTKMPAGAQIQFVYDLNQYAICQMDICGSTTTDRHFAVSNDWLTPGALVVRDLGYFNQKGFEDIERKSAFYLTRAFPRTAFFNSEKSSERIDLDRLVKRMKKYDIPVLETPVLFGLDGKRPARAIIELVPDQVRADRMKTIQSKRAHSKSNVSKEYSLWAGINVFLTNTTSDQLSVDQIMQTYRCRWQIELVFKTWKSFLEIHKFKAYKADRLRCYLFASLLLVLIQWRVFAALQEYMFKTKQKVLSIFKFTKVITHLKEMLRNVIRVKNGAFNILFNTLIRLSDQYLFKEKKNGKNSFIEALNIQNYTILELSDRKVRPVNKPIKNRTF